MISTALVSWMIDVLSDTAVVKQVFNGVFLSLVFNYSRYSYFVIHVETVAR